MAELASNEILAVVAAEIKTNGGDRVRTMVADMLIDAEIEKRAQALKKVMDLVAQEVKGMYKLGPDMKSFDATGKEVSANFSKKQVDERAKVQKRIDKMTSAINKALEKDDYGDVYNLQSGKIDDAAGKADGGDKPEGDTAAGA